MNLTDMTEERFADLLNRGEDVKKKYMTYRRARATAEDMLNNGRPGLPTAFSTFAEVQAYNLRVEEHKARVSELVKEREQAYAELTNATGYMWNIFPENMPIQIGATVLKSYTNRSINIGFIDHNGNPVNETVKAGMELTFILPVASQRRG
jgi:hypothetical protein